MQGWRELQILGTLNEVNGPKCGVNDLFLNWCCHIWYSQG